MAIQSRVCLSQIFMSLRHRFNFGVELTEISHSGYHPIHFGDVLNERYEVMHKLGHGTFGTVWICHDQKDQQYVAVKGESLS